MIGKLLRNVFFHGRKSGKRFFIFPPWEKNEEDCGRIPLCIDPGNTFGTGHHPTTELCLAFLEEEITKGCSLLDAGCGSGVLGIAAALLGAERVLGFDIDAQAAGRACENAVLNGVENTARFVPGEIYDIKPGKYDVIAANMLPVRFLDFYGYLTENFGNSGLVIFSGILNEQEQAVTKKLQENGFALQKKRQLGEWTALKGTL